MDRQQKIELVRGVWEAFARGDMKTVFAAMPEDVTWKLPQGGQVRGKSSILHLARASAGKLKGYQTEIRRVHCDGDSVILEMTNRGTTPAGKPYANKYCFIFDLDGAKISNITEYTDQLTFKEAVGDAEFDDLRKTMAPVVESIDA
jgi:ketosteroid isomerase-like protein